MQDVGASEDKVFARTVWDLFIFAKRSGGYVFNDLENLCDNP